MPVQSVNSGYGQVVGAQESTPGQLNKVDFLNLLIAQIKHQDPMSPMDNQQFISQLTEFTSLDELNGVNQRLDDNLVMIQSLNNTMMLGLVGREVTVGGETTTVSAGQVTSNRIRTSLAGTATVQVKDESGYTVATYTAPVKAGLSDITWDGLLADGEQAPDGTYSLEVAVVDGGDREITFTPFMSGRVDSLRFENNLAIVEVGGHDYYVSEILAVSNS